MKNFRKKPIEVEAWQLPRMKYTDRSRLDAPQTPRFLEDAIQKGIVTPRPSALGYTILYIKTLEGRMKASPKDWIVCGLKGELYPVKPAIFKLTYEAI
jgi:hypothetical protein